MASGLMFMGMLEMMMLSFVGGGQGVPLPVGLPPTPEDAVLSQVAPAEKPLFLITWAGTADADANSANKAERILALGQRSSRHIVSYAVTCSNRRARHTPRQHSTHRDERAAPAERL